MMTNHEAADLLDATVLNQLGIFIRSSVNDMEIAKTTMMDIGNFPIAPMALGPFAGAIESMNVTISVGISEHGMHLKYEYRYHHTDECRGGSNGITRGQIIPAP